MIKKITLNFNISIINIIGLVNYIKYCITALKLLLEILKTKTLSEVDKRMNTVIPNLKVKYHGKNYNIPINDIDTIIKEDSYAFGLVREIYFRQCYTLFLTKSDLEGIKTVIDLGGNRGLVSLLFSKFCERLHIVEMNEKYKNSIECIMNINEIDNYDITTAFIGGKTKYFKSTYSHISLDEYLDEHDLEYVDFLKIDIEGSEFELIADSKNLNKIHFIAMEIHHEYGNVRNIISKLKELNFSLKTLNVNLVYTSDNKQIDFIFAENLEYRQNKLDS